MYRDGDKVTYHLDSAIKESIERSSPEMFELILDFELKYYDFSSTRIFGLMSAIVKTGCLGKLKLVCGLRHQDNDSSDNDRWWKEACIGSHPDIVEYLLINGFAVVGDLDLAGARGYGCETPLHWVAKAGKDSIAKVLIQYGADIDYHVKGSRRGGSTPTPFKTAVYSGNVEVAQALIDAGANIDIGYPLTAIFGCQHRERERPEVFATTRKFATTQLLLAHGMPIKLKDASSIEHDAKLLVMMGERWIEGDLDPEDVMALICVGKRMMETIPRWRIPYADFYIRSNEARDLLDVQWFMWRYGAEGGIDRPWPNMYFLRRVLRNVARGTLRKLIPRKHKYLVADARSILCWLEDWRD
ncbi:hypothetical protein K491DRAFT_720028 [Lophiostoma macrostomum CBS 122681]|uniref:Uncharacterized protein n=1 Tax=Lophiostoma macrostomum CBS 122681 TaxID=1314788 RepID=A0A6A6SUJ8_9PLEO|nr:hypothetical protein K491DRAFT_720028 [Lophiostoma macrostomum CBS 122681]